MASLTKLSPQELQLRINSLETTKKYAVWRINRANQTIQYNQKVIDNLPNRKAKLEQFIATYDERMAKAKIREEKKLVKQAKSKDEALKKAAEAAIAAKKFAEEQLIIKQKQAEEAAVAAAAKAIQDAIDAEIEKARLAKEAIGKYNRLNMLG